MWYSDEGLLIQSVGTEELNEEDQSLKNELEMLVARLQVNLHLWLPSLRALVLIDVFGRSLILVSTYRRLMPSKISSRPPLRL